MISIVAESLLKSLEESDDCREIRNRIINEAFEANVMDYATACQSINATAEAYFELGFRSALKMILDVAK